MCLKLGPSKLPDTYWNHYLLPLERNAICKFNALTRYFGFLLPVILQTIPFIRHTNKLSFIPGFVLYKYQKSVGNLSLLGILVIARFLLKFV